MAGGRRSAVLVNPDRRELSWATGHFCTDFSSLLRIRHTKAAGTMIGFDLYILLLREPCELHPCYWLDNHRGCGCHHPRFGLGGAQVEWRYARLTDRGADSFGLDPRWQVCRRFFMMCILSVTHQEDGLVVFFLQSSLGEV